jgi:hypothetical protein
LKKLEQNQFSENGDLKGNQANLQYTTEHTPRGRSITAFHIAGVLPPNAQLP